MESILVTIQIVITFIKSKLTSYKVNKLVSNISQQFENVSRPTFLGIKNYESKSSGEIADHVILTNFSYKNAVKRDLQKLQVITENEKIRLAINSGFSIDLINEAIEKLSTSFINNQNEETKSNQSKAQTDAFTRINEAIKIHNETGQVYIYGLHIKKNVHVDGEYKKVNSRPLTLCQNWLKKELNFSTSKYRQFIVDKNMLSAVNLNGESFQLT